MVTPAQISQMTMIQETNPIQFTNHSKMSLSLVELRINNHLNRIMKNFRLINFCNAIKNLPIHSRLCEKLIEIMNSCQGLIERKMPLIKQAKDVLVDLRQIHGNNHPIAAVSECSSLLDNIVDFNAYNSTMTTNTERKDKMMKEIFYERIKQVCHHTEQIVWALNSNKEHIRYIARVMVIPEVYHRANGNNNVAGDFSSMMINNYSNHYDYGEFIWLRQQMITVVRQCETIIQICKLVRTAIASLIKDIYSDIDGHGQDGDSN